MKSRIAIWIGSGVVALSLAGFGGWILSLPPAPAFAAAPPVAAEENAAALAAMRPPKRERPLIAVVGINDATETTDYLMTYGILRRTDVADVLAIATEPGPVRLYPALTVEPDAALVEFDAAHLEGADYVIVPAFSWPGPASKRQGLPKASVAAESLVEKPPLERPRPWAFWPPFSSALQPRAGGRG